ncbi:MAG: homoserine kinase [Gammaproteobacteria bacterium]|nr:homoserine kinase [Gammaproteobacteria bacterium]
MSVFTSVSSEQLQIFLCQFNLGSLINFEGISAGIENSNYFVNTTEGAFVLTLYEKHSADEINFSVQLGAFLAAKGLAVSYPLAAKDGRLQRDFLGKATVLSQRIVGQSVFSPKVQHCQQLGTALAKVHHASQTFPLSEPKLDAHLWRQQSLQKLHDKLDPETLHTLQQLVRRYQDDVALDLPQGALHSDLFRDNVLFEGDQLSGIIDFNSAVHSPLLFDVAVVLNDWCSRPDGSLDLPLSRAFMSAYQGLRPFSESEHRVWPRMCELSALRFWLSRLLNQHFRQASELTCDKDPEEYRCLFLHRQRHPIALRRLYDD